MTKKTTVTLTQLIIKLQEMEADGYGVLPVFLVADYGEFRMQTVENIEVRSPVKINPEAYPARVFIYPFERDESDARLL